MGNKGLAPPSPAVDNDVHAKQEEAPVQDLLNENNLNAAAQGIPDVLPVLPVRDVVIFNYMILPLFIGREKSVQAVESALKNGRHLLVCAQREESTDDPAPADLYNVGTVVQVMRMLKMPDSRVKILVQGVSRARVTGYSQVDPIWKRALKLCPKSLPRSTPRWKRSCAPRASRAKRCSPCVACPRRTCWPCCRAWRIRAAWRISSPPICA